MASSTISVEPSDERHRLQVSYLLDAFNNTKTDKGDSVPAGAFRKFRATEKEGILVFNVLIPRSFPSSWFKTIGIDRPDCSLRSGAEESGDPDYHVLKLTLDQFPADMREHIDFLRIVENNIGVVEMPPESGGGPKAFLGYGLHSAIVRGLDYVFTIPADISVRPFAGFLGLDRRKIIREMVVDASGVSICDGRDVPLHRFAVPVAQVRTHFANQSLDGQKTVTFSLPKNLQKD